MLPLLGALAAVTLIPVWQNAYLPLQDLGLHLIKVDLLRRYWAGDPEVQALYQVNAAPFPDWTCFAALALLSPFTDLMTASRLYVSAYTLALPLAAYAWIRRVNPTGLLMVLAVPAITHNLFLVKGNLNFCASLVLYLCALLAWEAPRRWPFAIAATALYFTHGIGFFALVGTTGLRVLLWRTPENLRRAVGLVPGLVLFVISWLLNSEASRQTVPWPLVEIPRLYDLLAAIPWLFGPQMFAPLAMLWAAVLLASMAVGLLRSETGMGIHSTAPRLWFLNTLGFGAAFVFCTTRIGEWSHFRQRFLPLALFALLGVAGAPRSRSGRAVLALLFTVTTVVATIGTSRHYRKGSDLVSEYLAAAGTASEPSSLLPLDHPEDVWARPAVHAWGLHQIAHPRTWTPYLDLGMVAQARMIYPVLYRTHPWAPPQSAPVLEADTIRRAAECYDFVVLWRVTDAASVQEDALLDVHYERIHTGKHTQVWRNRRGVRAQSPASAACQPPKP